MAEQQLDGTHIGAGLEEVGGKRVAQQVRREIDFAWIALSARK